MVGRQGRVIRADDGRFGPKGSHTTVEYARKRIVKLKARITETEFLDPDAVTKRGHRAAHQIKLDRITLKRWKEKLTELGG